MLIKGIVLSTSFSFVCGALNRAVHFCYTIHFHTSLPLISAEALCMDYWCDMIRVSWCLAQLAFVSWLKYLCGLLSAGNFSSSLSPLGLKPHLVCFEWLFSQALSQVVAVPVPGPSRSMVLLVWSHSERVILCERSKCINSQCCRHSIELLFVFWIWLWSSSSSSVPPVQFCAFPLEKHCKVGYLPALCVCFTRSLQRALNTHARRLKSCFYLTNRPNYSTNYGIEVSLLFPKLCALFLNVEALLGQSSWAAKLC